MKKLLMSLFVFSIILVGYQVHSAIAQENLSITLESNPQASNGTVTVNLGDAITFTGFPNNLTGAMTTDYTRSFNFDPIFDGVCNQNGSNDWSQKCIPTQTGTGTFSIQVTQNGQVYNSNVIKIKVISDIPATLNNGCINGKIYDSTTGQKCPETSYQKVNVKSPNGRETFTQGMSNKISWTGGKNKVQIGLFSYNSGLIGYIDLNEKPNSNTTWNGLTLKSLDGLTTTNVNPGDYRIVAISESAVGNYCINDDQNTCNSDLSDNVFTISSSSAVETSCQVGEIFSSKTGKKCFKKDEVKDMGCIAGRNYSSMTGKPCALGLNNKDNTDVVNPTNSTVPNKISIRRTLKHGVSGDDVKALQLFLNIKADGVFGNGTAEKVRQWQRVNGLTTDGAFGLKSRQTAGLE